MNTIIERERDEKSCYVRCDCGSEILGFHYNKWDDGETYYNLSFYGYREKKDWFPDFYFKTEAGVLDFVDTLNSCIDSAAKVDGSDLRKSFIFEDYSISGNQLKRLGPSILNVEIDKEWDFIDILKFKSKKHLNKKKPKCTWDICFRFEEFRAWAAAIKEILNGETATNA